MAQGRFDDENENALIASGCGFTIAEMDQILGAD